MDWYVLLTPLLLLPIASLLVFVGCELEKHGSLASNDPGPLKGLEAHIDISGGVSAVQGYVLEFEFWCEKADGGKSASAHAKVPEGPWPFPLLLTGAFLDPPFECSCAGLVTKTDGTVWPVDTSQPKTYTIDPPGPFFWVSVTKDPQTKVPIKFSLT